MQTALLEALADEAARMLDEGVVAEAADIDTCMILGAGWPFWLGGITKFLDQTGVSERVAGRLPAGTATPADRRTGSLFTCSETVSFTVSETGHGRSGCRSPG